MAIHAGPPIREKSGLNFVVVLNRIELGRLAMTFQTKCVGVSTAYRDRRAECTRIVFVKLDNAFGLRVHGTQNSGCGMAGVALVVQNVAVLIVHGCQALATRIFHIVHVGLHRYMAGGTKLHGLGVIDGDRHADWPGK